MLKCVFKPLQTGGLFILKEIIVVKQHDHGTLSDNKKPYFPCVYRRFWWWAKLREKGCGYDGATTRTTWSTFLHKYGKHAPMLHSAKLQHRQTAKGGYTLMSFIFAIVSP